MTSEVIDRRHWTSHRGCRCLALAGIATSSKETDMTFLQSPNLLRQVLWIDAATCIAIGLLTTLGAAALARLFNVPADLLWYAGLSLFPIAAFIAYVARQAVVPLSAVWLIVFGNIGWVLGSVWLLFGGAISPNALGYAFITIQAVAVAIIAELEIFGMKRAGAASTA
jgi:hypothetical protein